MLDGHRFSACPQPMHCVFQARGPPTCLDLSLPLSSGFYGSDCALSLGEDGKPVLLAGTGYTTRKKRPHIYVYELPPYLNTW